MSRPIAYFYTDGFYFLIGSNWGKEQNAGWYYNLLAQPRTTIEVKGRTIPVEARPAEGPQYERTVGICHPAPSTLSCITRK